MRKVELFQDLGQIRSVSVSAEVRKTADRRHSLEQTWWQAGEYQELLITAVPCGGVPWAVPHLREEVAHGS
ncbi:hypothetical protein SS37A_40590 (plasmid) [Methylocystis iwaonis]|uniref:Uncharacterized protein n=1 Tax=Methylocystis iwaonis TaxID=2885079 RepID=A0ABM8EEZ5_9HYPH|nr:hypothetical protein SS37A_40590 [Methylocystis iwaonis]